jgi:hypothetical protein
VIYQCVSLSMSQRERVRPGREKKQNHIHTKKMCHHALGSHKASSNTPEVLDGPAMGFDLSGTC